jgi:hypothetical protein
MIMRRVSLIDARCMSVAKHVRLTSYQERYHNKDISLHHFKTRGTFIFDQKRLNISIPRPTKSRAITSNFQLDSQPDFVALISDNIDIDRS